MKNLKKIIVSLLAMTMLFSTTVFAATAKDVAEAGVPADLAQSFADYVVANKIEDTVVNAVVADLKGAQALIGDAKSVADLSTEAKDALKALQDSFDAIGINVDYADGKVVISTTTDNQKKEYTYAEALALVKNANSDKLTTVIAEIAKDGKLQADATDANDTTDEMAKTASNNGNVLALGLGVIAVAGVVYVVAKKKVVA